MMTSIEALALEYVLGSLSAAEREDVERRRLYTTALDAEISRIEQLYSGLLADDAAPPVDTEKQGELWQRISAALGRESLALSGNHVEECAEGGWQHYKPLIEMKPLWAENVILIRCNPGAEECLHDQPNDADEHILVIAGDIELGGRVFGTGDYICIPAGSVHQPMTTHGGCLLFTEYVAAPSVAAAS